MSIVTFFPFTVRITLQSLKTVSRLNFNLYVATPSSKSHLIYLAGYISPLLDNTASVTSTDDGAFLSIRTIFVPLILLMLWYLISADALSTMRQRIAIEINLFMCNKFLCPMLQNNRCVLHYEQRTHRPIFRDFNFCCRIRGCAFWAWPRIWPARVRKRHGYSWSWPLRIQWRWLVRSCIFPSWPKGLP